MKGILYKILWATIEDFDGLWEVHWELNSLLPENSSLENREIAKKILLYFLEAELVILFYDKWGADELKEIKFEEAIAIIKDKRFWKPPALNEVCVKVGNTPKGENFYNEDLIDPQMEYSITKI